jgi:hypothetical protein
MMLSSSARPRMQQARAEEHGDDNAKESVIPHLVPP